MLSSRRHLWNFCLDRLTTCCHPDLKYENVLFVNDSAQSEIKLIDFGLSKKYGKDEELMEGVGTM